MRKQLYLHGVKRIVTGGQTGVDRAAMDAALELGIPLGGWCPRGRRAEDGPIDSRYPLQECTSPVYAVRTELNVRDSDGTLIIHRGPLQGGTRLTWKFARQYGVPVRRVSLDRQADVTETAIWLHDHNIKTLNVAGPRASTDPDIYTMAKDYLISLFTTRCLLCPDQATE